MSQFGGVPIDQDSTETGKSKFGGVPVSEKIAPPGTEYTPGAAPLAPIALPSGKEVPTFEQPVKQETPKPEAPPGLIDLMLKGVDVLSKAQGIEPKTGRNMLLGDIETGLSAGAGLGPAQGVIAPAARKAARTVGDEITSTLSGLKSEAPAVSDKAKFAKESAQKLMKEGVELTPGQIKPGLKSIEGAATSIPLFGGSVSRAYERSLETWNRALGNRILERFGEKLPNDVAPGYGMIDEIGTRISKQYEKAHDAIKFAPDEELSTSVKSIQHDYGELLNPAEKERLNSTIDHIVNSKLYSKSPGEKGFMGMVTKPGETVGKEIDGKQLQLMRSELRSHARALRRSTSVQDHQIGHALDDVNAKLGETLERLNPQAAKQLSAADHAYAELTRLEEAAARRAKSNGVFSPMDLSSSVRQLEGGPRNKAFARGEALMQDWANEGLAVLPHDVPDSGTASRLMVRDLAGNILGYTAGGAALGPASAAIPAAGLTGMAAYSRPVIRAMNKISTTDFSPARKAVGDFAKEVPVPLSLGAAQGPYAADIVSTLTGNDLTGKKQ